MKTPINQQLAKTQAALLNGTVTPAGQTTSEKTLDHAARTEAIVQLFAEFELVFHNQYTKAFGSQEKLNYARRLWYSHLKHYSPAVILQAAKIATRENEFLPTVHTMIAACDRVLGESGIPSVSSAYKEACTAPSPKLGYKWSHAIVYLAGRDTGWRYLHETPERQALPAFKEHYLQWRNRLLNGEVVELPLLENPEKDNVTDAQPSKDKSELLAQLDEFRQNIQL